MESSEFTVSGRPFHLKEVQQTIAMILDEKGAKIESESKLKSVAVDAQKEKPAPKMFIFNRPFWTVFKLAKENPYLVVWIKNNELLIKNQVINLINYLNSLSTGQTFFNNSSSGCAAENSYTPPSKGYKPPKSLSRTRPEVNAGLAFGTAFHINGF